MKNTNDIAISVKHISKDFILPHNKKTSLKGVFTGLFEPNVKAEKQHALKDINFDVKKGEFFGIVGRNGSGKSTLLKILAEIYRPTKGSIKVTGKLVPFIELGVGFNAELSGRENVYLSASLLGFTRKEIDAMYKNIVEFAELERFMDQKLKNYSSGMQVRLAFSIATRVEADILLVDEVLAVGDADFQRKCFNYFKYLKKQKKTVIFVSHDMNSIREYCDRAVLIENSKLVLEGTSDRVATAYTKLFNDSATPAKAGSDSKRWGNQTVHIDKPSLSPAKITDSAKSIELKLRLVASEKTQNINTGFMIKNGEGTIITGTNTSMISKKIPELLGGESRLITWTIPNIFSEGGHTVTLAVEADGTITDWWDEALTFGVVLKTKTPYIVSPKIEHKEI